MKRILFQVLSKPVDEKDCLFIFQRLTEIIIKELWLIRMDPTLESVLKSIPGGNNVINKLTLLLQRPTSNAKVGGTSSVTHVNGELLAPGSAIICNTTNSGFP